MVAPALHHVVVWLDELAPSQGAFAHALEWAQRLELTLHAVAAPLRRSLVGAANNWGDSLVTHDPEDVIGEARLAECEAACAEKGVRWTVSFDQGALRAKYQQSTVAVDLCVFGNFLPIPITDELLRGASSSPGTSVLVCAPTWKPVSRVLVLNQGGACDTSYRDTAARLCRALHVKPVVLTTAASVGLARQAEARAEEAFGAHRLEADFDLMVGCSVATAVEREARVRRCTHVIVEKPPARAALRWSGSDGLKQLFNLRASIAVLALPPLRQFAGAGMQPA